MKIGTTARNNMIAALGADLDGGHLYIRTGAAPTNPSDADSGTLLSTHNFNSPAFGSPSTGTIAAAGVSSDTNVAASGTAAHWRAKSSGGTVVAQGTAGTSGTEMILNTTSFVAGGTAAISSFNLTQPQ